MVFVIVHEKTMYEWEKIFSYGHHCQVQPLNYYSCKFEVASPCSHGDMSKNVPGSPVLKFCKKNSMSIAGSHPVGAQESDFN
jgi:hypothetical protein